MKLPKLPNLFLRRPKRKMHVTARRTASRMSEDEDAEPTTKLSTAFVIVLLIHVVAVGGIYAFQSIKAKRRAQEPFPAETATAQTPKSQSRPAPLPEPALPESRSAAAPSTTLFGPVSRGPLYQVKAGDNLTKIAAGHGVTVAALEEANHLKAGAIVRPGQTLTIPSTLPGSKHASVDPERLGIPPKKTDETLASLRSTPGTATRNDSKTYVVVKGDNPVTIARKFGVGYDELLKANKIDDPKKLKIGHTLKIPPKKE